MLKGILFLIAFGLLPWWLSLLIAQMNIPLSPSAFLSSWVRDDGLEAHRETPPPGWWEAVYFARNPDVMASVRRGELRSGYEHYIKYGKAEGRLGGIPDDPPGSGTVRVPPQASPVSPASPPVPEVAKPVAVATLPEALPPSPPPAVVPPVMETTPREEPPTEVAPIVLPTRKPLPAAPSLQGPVPAPKPINTGSASQVLGIRSAPHPGFIRVVLDSPVALRVERMPQPTGRVVGIELVNTGWLPARQGRLMGKSLSYRVETVGEVTRLLLESGESIRLKALFALPPEPSGGHHRLILDVMPTG
ncbi:hypothetical protein [Azospirillum sp.]|uniref:hypothetical protein n=1 Tax=Azospirillum sp. TaxID=34012 RepID=UPI00262B5775|nr:hypothetical protein [Azospirillum sp.]